MDAEPRVTSRLANLSEPIQQQTGIQTLTRCGVHKITTVLISHRYMNERATKQACSFSQPKGSTCRNEPPIKH